MWLLEASFISFPSGKVKRFTSGTPSPSGAAIIISSTSRITPVINRGSFSFSLCVSAEVASGKTNRRKPLEPERDYQRFLLPDEYLKCQSNPFKQSASSHLCLSGCFGSALNTTSQGNWIREYQSFTVSMVSFCFHQWSFEANFSLLLPNCFQELMRMSGNSYYATVENESVEQEVGSRAAAGVKGRVKKKNQQPWDKLFRLKERKGAFWKKDWCSGLCPFPRR